MNLYYTEDNFIILVPDHYSHTLSYIEETLEYAKSKGCTIPDKENIKVEVLGKPRFEGMLSIEFKSITTPTEGTLLTKNSGLWEWLKKK